MFCYNCGTENPDGASFCTSCGANLKADSSENNQSANTQYTSQWQNMPPMNNPSSQKKSGGSSKIVAIVIAIVAVIAIALVAGFVIKNNDDKRKAEAASSIAAAKAMDYRTNLKSISLSMLSCSADAEKAGNLILKVWNNAIFKQSDSETDKYVRPNGKYVSDFNDALNSLFTDSAFAAKIADLRIQSDDIKSKMKEMMDPPEEYSEAYNALKTYYEKYSAFVDVVENPSGSLNSFSERFRNTDTDAINAYKAIELYFE